MSRRACVAGVIASLGLARAAAAGDLSWSGPTECDQSEQLVFQVERALGAPLASAGRVHLQVHVARTRPDARARLRVVSEVAGADAPLVTERSLTAPDCSRLVDTLAVAITLALEAATPLGAEREPSLDASRSLRDSAELASAERSVAQRQSLGGERSAPAPSRPSSVEPSQPDAARAQAKVDADTAGPTPRVAALVAGDTGSLPAPALGVALAARLGWERFEFELVGTSWLERRVRLRSNTVPGAGGEVSLTTGALSACATPFGRTDSVAVALCAGAEVGRLSGTGTGINRPRQVNALWLAPVVHATVVWRPSGPAWGLGARVGVAAPLERDQFVLDEIGALHEPANVAGRAGLAFDIALQ